MKLATLRLGGLACLSLCIGQAATLRQAKIAAPVAVATDAGVSYCFGRVRGLDPERLPPAYLVLRLRVAVTYSNYGTRPVILPLEHERTIYTALQPGAMKVYKEGLGLFDPTLKVMKELPDSVNPNSPVNPKNDAFAIIPASGQMTLPLSEEITMPVNPKGLFKRSPDLRGHRLYLKLRFSHRELSPALQANLSDRWSRFGVPWSGTLTTNTILVDVPAAPQAAPCKDRDIPAHPVKVSDDNK